MAFLSFLRRRSPQPTQTPQPLELRTQVLLLVFVAIALMGVSLAAHVYFVVLPGLHTGLRQRAKQLVWGFAQSIVHEGHLQSTAEITALGNDLIETLDVEVLYLVVVRDPGNEVVYARLLDARPDMLYQLWKDIPQDPEPTATSRTIAGLPVIDAVFPFHSEHATGVIRLGLSQKAVRERESEFRLAFFGIFVLAFLLSAGLARYLVPRFVRPLGQLAETTERVGKGDLSAVARFDPGCREVARLDHSIRLMVERLRRASEERDALFRQLLTADRLAAVGQVAAGIAHEVNNPLDGARELVRHILDKPEDVGRIEQMGPVIVDSLDRIAQVVRGLLDFARPRDSALGSYLLADLAQNTISLVHSRLHRVGITLRTTGRWDTHVTLDADAFSQVLLNLLINAIDAIDEQTDRVAPGVIHLHAVGGEDDALVLYIADNGPGVRAELRNSIFEPFITTKPPGAGTGLGLAVSRDLARGVLHGDLRLVDATQDVSALPSDVRAYTGAIMRWALAPGSLDATGKTGEHDGEGLSRADG